MNLPVVLTDKNSTFGVQFLGFHSFVNGHKVPLYDITTMNALNQIIGHAKFGNNRYGNVYYRGVTDLYDNALPSFFRKKVTGRSHPLRKMINQIYTDSYFQNSLKVEPVSYSRKMQNNHEINLLNRHKKYIIEGLLQHYSGNTRFLDVVDNHWVALWMGLHSFVMAGKGSKYCKCEKRELTIGDVYQAKEIKGCPIEYSRPITDSIYEYILLLAMPYAESNPQCGIIETDEFVEVDLRKALPSFYLRPHAQHALVIRRRDISPNVNNAPVSYYDMASQVIAILRVRIDRAALWLGNGNLLTASNLFPSPSVDQGYNNLLLHPDLFNYPFEIIKYY